MKRILNKRNRTTGFSLVSVLLIGMCAVLWISAMTTAVLPLYQRAAQTKLFAQLRAACEAGIDFTADALTAAAVAGSTSTYDNTSFVLPTTAYSAPGITVQMTVKSDSPLNTSSIYDKTVSNWRVIKAQASSGLVSRTIRVVLKGPPANGSLVSNNPNNLNPLSKYGLFAPGNVNVGAWTTTGGYFSDSGAQIFSAADGVNPAGKPLGGDVSSYANVTLNSSAGNVVVGGSVDVPAGGLSAVGSNDTTAVINRYLTVNGSESGFADTTMGGNVNVYGMSNGSSAFQPDTSRGGLNVEVNQTNSAAPIPQSPNAPTSFQDGSTASAPINLGDLNLTTAGGANAVTLMITNSVTGLTISGNTISAPPGNYILGSLAVGDNNQIQISSNVSSSQPVRFFIQDSSSSSSAINIRDFGIVNNSPTPSNLQIFYNGTKPVSITQNNSFNGLVFTPNAPISIGRSSGGQTLYTGSFVGSTMNTSYAYVLYDQTMASGGSNGYMSRLSSQYNAAALKGYRVISYQEL